MKKLSSLIFTVFASLAIFASSVLPTFATNLPSTGTEYFYTVRFMVGSQGIFNKAGIVIQDAKGNEITSPKVTMSSDNTVITVEDIEYGSRISFDPKSVDVTDANKYYVKGIRESGMDNNTITNNSFYVVEDIDYVVGYALYKDAVAYTINYLDNKGNVLFPSETLWGNVGDRPVIAYRFMDDYLPQAYNLTGTLLADASKNIFTFVYTPLSELPDYYRGYINRGIIDRGVTGEEGVIVIPGNGGQAGGGAAGGQGGQEGTDIIDENAALNGGEEQPQGPAEILDIRDEESALSDGNGIFDGLMDDLGIDTESPSAFFTSIPVWAKIVAVTVVLLIVGLTAYLLFIRRSIKSKNEEE